MDLFNTKKNASLLTILSWLTLLTISAQIIFFTIHYKVSDLFDSLVQSSLKEQIFHSVILLPIIGFFLIQLIAYIIFVMWTWFITISISELFKLSRPVTFWLSIFMWLINCTTILSLNNYYFPDSFFATLIPTNRFILFTGTFTTSLSLILGYINVFRFQRHRILGGSFIFLALIFGFFSLYIHLQAYSVKTINQYSPKPNIILIGLDSVRPDFVSYFNQHASATPQVDSFLQDATIFTQAYTPLARTFTSWMSILTAQYPKHSNARSNLADPDLIHAKETLATTLKANGYETIYATDEKRFSNITERYGFDRLLGPQMGINDFILGGLNDFPLTNLIINSALGSFLFPYNYANRAAAITYEPDNFLQMVKLGLANRSDKPLFLAIHLCISHWPFTWARDGQIANANMAQKYQSSVTAVDKQFGELMQILQVNGLLKHSIVVLLSDHGTTVGLPHDRLVDKTNYQGNIKKLNSLSIFRLSSADPESSDFKHDYTMNTSYGQGTDVLSLKQYHTLLAFKGFDIAMVPRKVTSPVMLMDIAPTILSLLNLAPLPNSDGISLKKYLTDSTLIKNLPARALFIETGHSIAEIETNDIFINQVVKNTIGIYQINSLNGQLFIKPAAENSITRSKQRAVLFGDWLLARYPATTRSKLVPTQNNHLEFKKYVFPAFFVIANLKSKQWSIGLDSPLAQKAPTKELLDKLNSFYGKEMKPE